MAKKIYTELNVYGADIRAKIGTNQEMEIVDEVLEGMSTGVYYWTSSGMTKVNANTIQVFTGKGHIIDFHLNPTSPSYNKVTWNTQNVVITGVTNDSITYILVNSGATIIQQSTAPSFVQRRDNLFLGRVVHLGGQIVQVQPTPDIIISPANQLHELMTVIGVMNRNLTLQLNNNLTILTQGGSIMVQGAGYTTNNGKINEVVLTAQNPITFAYFNRNAGSTGALTTLVDPTTYDSNGVTTTITGTNNRTTLQHIYVFPSGSYRIQRGQAVYNSITEAIQATQTETFTINPNVANNGLLLGILAVSKGCTNLQDTATARFLPASKFGESVIGGGGLSVTTLQNAYFNSTDGTITLDSIRTALKIKNYTETQPNNYIEFITSSNLNVLKLFLDSNYHPNVTVGVIGASDFTGRLAISKTLKYTNQTTNISIIPVYNATGNEGYYELSFYANAQTVGDRVIDFTFTYNDGVGVRTENSTAWAISGTRKGTYMIYAAGNIDFTATITGGSTGAYNLYLNIHKR